MITSLSIKLQVACLLVLTLPASAFAASTITLASSGGGVFQLQGVNIEQAAAMDISILYDAATLANPRVAAGPLIAGAMTAVNPNHPGTLRIAIIRTAPVTGSGVISTISFDVKGPDQGRITSLRAKLSNINGVQLKTTVQISNPTAAALEGAASGATTAAHDPVKPAPPFMGLLADQPGKSEAVKPAVETGNEKDPDSQPIVPEFSGKPDTHAGKTGHIMSSSGTGSRAQRREKEIYSQESVLDRFKAYKGERTPASFVALFEQPGAVCRQEPPVAISDGKSPVKVVFLTPPGKIAPSDVAVMGARFVSLKGDLDNTNTWIIELIPEKNSYQAGFAISQKEMKTVCPLTITPKISVKSTGSGSRTEDDFNVFLKARKSAKKTKQADLNDDGKSDYIDDYIFTANYVNEARQPAKGTPVTSK